MSLLQLKKIRINKGISQEQIADLIGMTQSNYSRRENGKKEITDSEWKKIAKVLDVKIEEIYSSGTPDLIALQQEEFHMKNDLNSLSKYIVKLEKENASLKEKIKTISNKI